MKNIFTLICCSIGLYAVQAQTSCATAIPVELGVHNATFEAGSEVPSLICVTGGNGSPSMAIWYSYTSSEILDIEIRTDVNGTPDTRMRVFTGNCDALECVTGDDDSGDGYASLVNFTAQAGVTYYIAFDNRWSSADFQFEVNEYVYVPPMFEDQTIDISGTYVMCVTDMNGDYMDDIVIPDFTGVRILYQQADGSFEDVVRPAQTTPYMPGWSMAAGDFDANGFNDLLYGHGSGATLMLANEDGTEYTAQISPQSIFSQRTNFIDLNNDGNLDAFVCHDVAPNCYFLNDGNGSFTWHQGGIGDYPAGGNYGSIWVDYDNDGDADMFIAKCRGGGNPAAINELHRNDGNGVFVNVAEEANLADMLQTWSTAWGDFDNDGDMDALVGANSIANGTHKLMLNNGDGTFSDATEGSGFADLTAMSREHITHDFNNDGWLDIMGGGNDIMFNNGNLTFTKTSCGASVGPVGDLNNDGFLDILNYNHMKINSGNDNNWLKVHLEGSESNRNGIGARIEVYATGDGWEKQIRDVRSGDGFRFMSSLNTHFGLGLTETVDQVVIKWPSGIIDVIENPEINQPLFVQEGSTLAAATYESKVFSIYPNPVNEALNINNNGAELVQSFIYDISGKLISNLPVVNNSIDVHNLAKGNYILIVKEMGGKHYTTKFIKK